MVALSPALLIELLLNGDNLLKESVDLCVDLVAERAMNFAVFWGQITSDNVVHELLTHLKTRANLVRQPSGDWGATSRARVLRVVDNVGLDHRPVLVAETVSGVHILEQEES